MKVYRSSRFQEQVADSVWDSKSRIAAGSLFDRLVLDDEDLEPAVFGTDIDGVVRSIRRNLNRALNVHAGSAAANLDFGIPDFNFSTVGSLEISTQLVQSIRHCIEIAEPRVHNIQVSCLPNPDSPLDLNFAITCEVDVDQKEETIRIDIAMRDGRFHNL